MTNGKPDVYIVRCAGSNMLWGAFTCDPEPMFALFAEVTGYDKDDFYVEHQPLYDTVTKDTIGHTYS